MIKFSALNINSIGGQDGIIHNAIENIENSQNIYGINHLLGLNTLQNTEPVLIILGYLSLIPLDNKSELSKAISRLISQYSKRLFIINKRISSKGFGSVHITITEKQITESIISPDGLVIEKDAFRITSNSQKTILTYLYKGKHKETGRDLAIKKIKFTDNKDIEKYKKEIEILKRLSDKPYFIKFYGSMKKDNELYIIMEYIQCSLMDIIRGSPPLTEVKMNHIIKKLVEAYAFLESLKIFHRDVKPDNILIRENGDPVIIDFGISDYNEIEKKSNSVTGQYLIVGTLDYMSPEVLEAFNSKNSFFNFNKRISMQINPIKADVYSLGLTILQMLTGEDVKKYQDKKGNQLLLKNIKEKIEIPYLQNMLISMLSINPIDRPTFNNLLGYLSNSVTEQI